MALDILFRRPHWEANVPALAKESLWRLTRAEQKTVRLHLLLMDR